MSYRISFTRSSKRQHEKLDTTVKNRIDKSFRQLVDYYDRKASKKPDVIFQVRGEEFVILVVQIVKRGDAYR